MNLSNDKIVLTTEKDFGRLRPKINDREIYYIEVLMKFNIEMNEFNFSETISDYINKD